MAYLRKNGLLILESGKEPSRISSYTCDYCGEFEVTFNPNDKECAELARKVINTHENGCDENPVNMDDEDYNTYVNRYHQGIK